MYIFSSSFFKPPRLVQVSSISKIGNGPYICKSVFLRSRTFDLFPSEAKEMSSRSARGKNQLRMFVNPTTTWLCMNAT